MTWLGYAFFGGFGLFVSAGVAGRWIVTRPDERDRQPRTDWRTRKVAGRPWQDIIFAIGEIVFLVALIPLLWTRTKVPVYTGLSTGLMLYLFGLCQLSYRNWITLALGLTTATIWILLGLGVSF